MNDRWTRSHPTINAPRWMNLLRCFSTRGLFLSESPHSEPGALDEVDNGPNTSDEGEFPKRPEHGNRPPAPDCVIGGVFVLLRCRTRAD